MSSYRLVKEYAAPGTIELRYPHVAHAVWSSILWCVGGALFAAGFWYYMGGEARLHWDLPFPAHIVGFSFGLIFIGIAVATHGRRIPQRIVFDNRSGVMRILQRETDSDDKAALIGYDEIEGFHLQKKVSTRSSNRGGKTKSITYTAQMHKFDSSIWVFCEHRNCEVAKNFCRELQKNVDLKVAPEKRAYQAVANMFVVDKRENATNIYWKRRNNFRITATFLCISIGVCLVASFFPPVAKYFVWFFFGGLMGGLPLLALLCSLGVHQVVTVNPQHLALKQIGGIGHKSFSVPMEQVVAIMFNFSVNAANNVIYVRKADEMQQAIDVFGDGKVSFKDIGTIVRFALNQTAIDPGMATIFEIVCLEQLIQNALKEYGHTITEDQKQLLRKFLDVQQQFEKAQRGIQQQVSLEDQRGDIEMR